jgi:hypothetical protein
LDNQDDLGKGFLRNCGSSSELPLKETHWKWLFVFFCATLTTGVYFSYNIPSVLRK